MENRFYTKSELAQTLLPDILPTSAVNRMMIWIKRNPKLMADLKALGYNKSQKYLSPKMVQLIADALVM